MATKLQEMSYFDLKGMKKAAAFRGERKLEMMAQEEMMRRVQGGLVSEDEIIAAAYL